MDAYILLDQIGKGPLLATVRKKILEKLNWVPSGYPVWITSDQYGGGMDTSTVHLGQFPLQTNLCDREVGSAPFKPCARRGRNSFLKWREVWLPEEGGRENKYQGVFKNWGCNEHLTVFLIHCIRLPKWPQFSTPSCIPTFCHVTLQLFPSRGTCLANSQWKWHHVNVKPRPQEAWVYLFSLWEPCSATRWTHPG